MGKAQQRCLRSAPAREAEKREGQNCLRALRLMGDSPSQQTPASLGAPAPPRRFGAVGVAREGDAPARRPQRRQRRENRVQCDCAKAGAVGGVGPRRRAPCACAQGCVARWRGRAVCSEWRCGWGRRRRW